MERSANPVGSDFRPLDRSPFNGRLAGGFWVVQGRFDTFAVFDAKSRKVLFVHTWMYKTDIFDFKDILQWELDIEHKEKGYSETTISPSGAGSYAVGKRGFTWEVLARADIIFDVKDVNDPQRRIYFRDENEARLWFHRIGLLVNEGCSI